MHTKGAEIKTGIVVIAASVALLGLLFYATGGALFGEWRYVHLRIEPGDLAPAVGDSVEVNGVEVGTICEVRLQSTVRVGEDLTDENLDVLGVRDRVDAQGQPRSIRRIYVLAVAKLPEDQELPEGTRGVISAELTGSRQLRLQPGNSPRSLSDGQTRTSPIPVRQAPGLTRLSDRVDELALKATALLDELTTAARSADDAIREARTLIGTVRTKIEEGRVDEILADVRGTTAALKRTIEALEKDMARITVNVEAASADVRRLAGSGARIVEGAEADVATILEDVKGVVARLDGILARSAPKVDSFLDDINRTSRNLTALSAELRGIGPEAEQVIAETGRDLDALMAILTDTGRNLLDASEDLRAHPWKLLNEPSTDVIAYENLRNTMQNYVRAMQRMNEASGSLRALLADGPVEDPATRALLARTLADLERSVDAYRTTEARLLDLLREGTPAGAGGR